MIYELESVVDLQLCASVGVVNCRVRGSNFRARLFCTGWSWNRFESPAAAMSAREVSRRPIGVSLWTRNWAQILLMKWRNFLHFNAHAAAAAAARWSERKWRSTQPEKKVCETLSKWLYGLSCVWWSPILLSCFSVTLVHRIKWIAKTNSFMIYVFSQSFISVFLGFLKRQFPWECGIAKK